MTDESTYYFQYFSPLPEDEDFGRPQAWLWGDDEDDEPADLCFSPEDYKEALDLVYSAMSARGQVMPSPTEFHDMILDVADAFATNRRLSGD
jgi:hypothetical protein